MHSPGVIPLTKGMQRNTSVRLLHKHTLGHHSRCFKQTTKHCKTTRTTETLSSRQRPGYGCTVFHGTLRHGRRTIRQGKWSRTRPKDKSMFSKTCWQLVPCAPQLWFFVKKKKQQPSIRPGQDRKWYLGACVYFTITAFHQRTFFCTCMYLLLSTISTTVITNYVQNRCGTAFRPNWKRANVKTWIGSRPVDSSACSPT